MYVRITFDISSVMVAEWSPYGKQLLTRLTAFFSLYTLTLVLCQAMPRLDWPQSDQIFAFHSVG